MTNIGFISYAGIVVAALALPAVSSPAAAQGMTRTLEDLKVEYAKSCGAERAPARARLLLAYDRAISFATGPARRKFLMADRRAVANDLAPKPCPTPPAPRPPVIGTEPVAPLPVPGEVEDVCKRPAPNPRAVECRKFQLLLGRWTSPEFGGVIETVLTPNGTITGTILADNKYMRDRGYRAGMQILRNWQPALSGGTWVVTARNGESFYAKQPDRKPGEIYGTPTWNMGGILVIMKADTNIMAFPNDGRLSDHKPWVRVGNPR